MRFLAARRRIHGKASKLNYLAHAYRHLDRPYFAAGTALPDWMNVIDRKNRARRQFAEPVLQDADPYIVQFAAGVLQHHEDDQWFHGQECFIQLSSQFSIELRRFLGAGLSHQAAFVGHISIELLIDAWLIECDGSLVDRYYQMMHTLDVQRAQTAANKILRRPIDKLPMLFERFSQERFIADYVDDSGLQYRLGGVMRRVGLPPLPDLSSWLPDARTRVYDKAPRLLPP